MEWIFTIAVGFVCIAYPILLLIYMFFLPIPAIILYFVWVISSIGSIVALGKRYKKWYEKMSVAFIATLVFTIVLMWFIVNSGSYMFGENVVMWLFAPALNLPLMYFLGRWVRSKIDIKIALAQKKKVRVNNQHIQRLRKEIQELNRQLRNRKSINHLLQLFESCNCDVSALKNTSVLMNARMIENQIKEKENEIRYLTIQNGYSMQDVEQGKK